MQKKILFATLVTVPLLFLAFRYAQKGGKAQAEFISRQEIYKNKLFASCSPDWSQLNSDSLANGIGILPGWGKYQWTISTKSDSARLYFQQAINMYYSFHIIEAMASFKKAARFDDTNAMIFWGQALAYGPNINDFAYAYTPEAFAAAQKAILLSGDCSVKEKALITAMGVRYTPDSTISRASLNRLYTEEMRKGYVLLPDDADIAALYVDAMMLLHPWDVWKHNGEPQPWTPKLIEVLEKTLQQTPGHPGANHYYIHTVEASPTPQRALQSAERLSKSMPSVSHMVHMPSHIYIRSGMYQEGIKVNELSVKGYADYLAAYPEVVNNAPLYLIHNLHMQTACAMMGSGYEYSSKTADACRQSFDTSYMSLPAPFGNFIQYVYMTPVINDVLFGKWESILKSPAITQSYVYANVLAHWARGMALARTKAIDSAKKELALLRQNMAHPDMRVIMQPFNAPVDAAKVAEKILEGIIAEEENNLPDAVKFFTLAIEKETALVYNEPKDWILPVRPWLGAALLKTGAFLKAEKVFREDLEDNPKNHWSLKGLYVTLQKQKKNAGADLVKKQLDKSVATGDLKNMPIVF